MTAGNMVTNVRVQVLRGSLAFGSGEFIVYACGFVRNMILARVLTKADYGVAAAFGMVLTILEFSSAIAVSRLVVQDRDGERPEFVATAHIVQLGSGILGATALLLSANLFARLLGIVDHQAAFLLLALLPIAKGLEHLDTARMERQLRFGPGILCATLPQVAMTALTWPLTFWMPDYRAVLVLLATKTVLSTLLTHLVAAERYRLCWNVVYLRRMLRFCWPLLLNGLLMFGVFQGDHVLVGYFYSLADLATYSAAAALALAPSLLFGRVLGAMMLPLMAEVQADRDKFGARYRFCIQAVAAFAVGYAVTMIVAASAWMTLAYGERYADGAIILAWMAAANVFRIIRFAPSTAALAKADSRNQLFANMMRVLSLGPAIGLGVLRQPLWTIAAVGLVGEGMACAYSLWRLQHRDSTPLSASLGPIAISAAGIAAAGVAAYCVGSMPLRYVTPTAIILGATGSGALVLYFSALRASHIDEVL